MKLLAAAAAAATIVGVTLASVPADAQYYPYPPVYAPPPPPYYAPYAPRPYYRPAYRRNPCPPYWTVQNGVCKPYRGY